MLSLQNEQISFFESILPDLDLQTDKRKALKKEFTLEEPNFSEKKSDRMKKRITKLNEKKIDRISELTKLLFQVAIGTGKAIANNRFNDFDALVMNFGCQITALDLYRKVRKKELCEEAIRVGALAREKLGRLQTLKQKTYKGGQTILTILKDADLDFSVSPDLGDLCRFRLLKLINDNKMKDDGNEIPFTNVKCLFKKENLSQVPCLDDPVDEKKLSTKTLGELIKAIQIEEAKKAADFIRQVASDMNREEQRTEIIQRLLGAEFEKKNVGGIVSLPLVYNTEACLRNFQGVLLIKNKLANCKGLIEGATPQKLFLRMPGEIILNVEEIAELRKEEPLLVLEGVVREGSSLAETVKEVEEGLIRLVLSNCAELPQYAGDDTGVIDDKEAQLEIERLRKLNLSAKQFYLDHFYCSSVEVER